MKARRGAVAGAAALCLAVFAFTMPGYRTYPPAQPLFLSGVCPDADGIIQAIPVGDDANTVMADVCAKDWQVHRADPAPEDPKATPSDPLLPLAKNALRDLRTLSPVVAGEAPAQRLSYAGWSSNWRYVWPRDAAFVATAYVRLGETESAREIYRFLAAHQRADGTFEARYRPDGTVPDEREPQFESVGWYIWGISQLLAALSTEERADVWSEFGASIAAAGKALLDATEGGLPAPSSDYWERGENRLTLSTAALTLAGLNAAAGLRDTVPMSVAEKEISDRARDRAETLTEQITQYFGPDYGRYGAGSDPDAALAFCLPPFQPMALPGALAAWEASLPLQYVEGSGGYAPGAGWKKDGISWTPQTTLHAWIAAESGDATRAKEILRWTAGSSPL
ncbi:hypothetical protein BSZ39_05595 [Bowdeniella nasicola]|uniref:Glycoside hydrolase family 15 n=1 Tax=Bowdeniella nasicola TaxID=208480 RepID=A0A1Q5Q306_9ACTO|nr:hypothetical protein [Bowdeniella nasicola]OKL54135.1 hypothetical protein BSZ39_05595 [Bowdeniella nasicola]